MRNFLGVVEKPLTLNALLRKLTCNQKLNCEKFSNSNKIILGTEENETFLILFPTPPKTETEQMPTDIITQYT